MKISELPEAYKIYTLVMSNKSEYRISGAQKEVIMNADTQWIDLPNGTSINKAFMVEISLDVDGTRDNAQHFIEELREIEKRGNVETENPLSISSYRPDIEL